MKTTILFEDSSLFVVYKPAGLATQSARVGEADAVSELKNYLAKKKEGTYVGVVHRLDQPVEGLLVFAKTKSAAAKLTGQLSGKELHKSYKALVYGAPTPESKRVVSYLMKEGNKAIVSQNKGKLPDGKEAILSYSTLKQLQLCAYLDVNIETGRFHQIRAQLSSLGHPILGDTKYGNEASMTLARNMGIFGVCLCADELSVRHPIIGKEMQFHVEPSFLEKIE